MPPPAASADMPAAPSATARPRANRLPAPHPARATPSTNAASPPPPAPANQRQGRASFREAAAHRPRPTWRRRPRRHRPPRKRHPAAAGSGDFQVQLAAMKSEAEAQAAWKKALAANKDLLGSLSEEWYAPTWAPRASISGCAPGRSTRPPPRVCAPNWSSAIRSASLPASHSPAAAIFGCAGTVLGDAEKAFYQRVDPLGFILFQRNCQSPDQVQALVASMRETVGRHAPVLIDQEGGRVQRLRPPHWTARPAMAQLRPACRPRSRPRQPGRRASCAPDRRRPDRARHRRRLRAGARRAGARGVTEAIGDRAISTDPRIVAMLGRAVSDALLDRRRDAGHQASARVTAAPWSTVTATCQWCARRAAELAAIDLVPFKAHGRFALGYDLPLRVRGARSGLAGDPFAEGDRAN